MEKEDEGTEGRRDGGEEARGLSEGFTYLLYLFHPHTGSSSTQVRLAPSLTSTLFHELQVAYAPSIDLAFLS